MSDRSAIADALARRRLLPFLMMAFSIQNPEQENLQPAWHLEAMCSSLERVAAKCNEFVAAQWRQVLRQNRLT